MKRCNVLAGGIAGVLLVAAGCSLLGNLSSQTPADMVTVQLVNTNSLFSVQAQLHISNIPDVAREDLVAAGAAYSEVIPGGQTVLLRISCAAVEALVIDLAELEFFGAGPQGSTAVYRKGTDFSCGQTIIFTFAGQIAPPELNISFSSQ
jgi:amino acid permease